MFRLVIVLLLLASSGGTCLSTQIQGPIYGWVNGNCIDTGRCLPLE